jgi:hypothetical protein
MLVVGPLLVFVPQLYQMREKALVEYGRLASQHYLAFHRRWFGSEKGGEELLGSNDPSSAADLNAIVETVQRLRFVPLDLTSTLQLLLAAGLPLVAVVLTQVPFASLVKWIVNTIV